INLFNHPSGITVAGVVHAQRDITILHPVPASLVLWPWDCSPSVEAMLSIYFADEGVHLRREKCQRGLQRDRSIDRVIQVRSCGWIPSGKDEDVARCRDHSSPPVLKSVYFRELPRAFSIGYFAAFFLIFSRA